MLVRDEILDAIGKGEIIITPFHEESLNPNSYDLHLAPTLFCYKYSKHFDFKKYREPDDKITLTSDGLILSSKYFYLACTAEHTETYNNVPELKCKSSTTRCSMDAICGGGFGDVSYIGHWTMALDLKIDIKVYPYMPICQVYYTPVASDKVSISYKDTGRYNGERMKNPEPTAYKPKQNPYWETEEFINLFN